MALSTSKAADTGGAVAPPEVQVWDPVVRLFHWSLVAAFTVAWLTADEWDAAHEWAGYAVAGLVVVRIVWGLVGTRNARFASFVRGPATTLAYLGDMLRRREARCLQHNPAGAAMIVALLFGLVVVSGTGWMMTLDQFSGVDWLEEVHELAANGLLALVALHVAGVLYASLSHGENLVKAMITGRKRA
ncbi:MAG: cytochrome B [Rhizobiales bacterium]|nr:cytochrome B [Hyphomicrobiales bacterium]